MNVFYQGMYMYLFRLRFLGFVARSKLLRTPNPTPADIPVMVAAFPAATSAGIAAAKGMIPPFCFHLVLFLFLLTLLFLRLVFTIVMCNWCTKRRNYHLYLYFHFHFGTNS